MTSLPDATASFGSIHFGDAQLGDVRRTRRLVRAADALVQHPGGTLPQKIHDPTPVPVRPPRKRPGQKKTPRISGCGLARSCAGRNRTYDLQVMSLAS